MSQSKLGISNNCFSISKLLIRLYRASCGVIFMSSAIASALARNTIRSMSPVVTTELSLQCSDGIQLAAQSWSKGLSNDNPKQNDSSSKHRILCLHGWMDNCRSFARLAPALIESLPDTTELVALDFPGHGWSSHKSMDGPPTLLAECAYYIAEAVEKLQWNHESTPFTVVGHSMGAAVGCVYAAAFPEQVEKLILLDGAGPLSRNPRDIAKHVRSHVNRRASANQSAKGPRVYPDLATAVETRCMTAKNFPGNQWLSTEAATEMVIRGSRTMEGGGIQFRHDPRLQWPSLQYFTLEQTEAIYQDIQCPTALFTAHDGWPFDEEEMKRTADLLQPSAMESFAGSHHFHADPETASDVIRKVLEFLQQRPQEELENLLDQS